MIVSSNKVNNVNVCIIVENNTVPTDRRVWMEANALSEAGYAVSVICPKSKTHRRAREVLDGISIYRYPCFESAGMTGHLVEYGWSLLAEFVLALVVYARTRFRVLQACNPPDTIVLIALFFKLFDVRFIFDHHDLVPELCQVRFARKRLLYRVACFAEWLTFQAADVAIATNTSFREIAVVRGAMARDRSFIVRTCPDVKRLNFTPKAELKEGRKYLVAYVGIMEQQDGLDLLLDSIRYIVNERGRKDTLFALIGWGTEVNRLKGIVAEHKLDTWVRFTGPLFGDDLWAYLSTADLAVAPDPLNVLNDKLSMIKIFEYMAFGLPVVLYDLLEGRRSAGNGAFYAKGNDPIDFAHQVEILLDSEAQRQSMGAIGKQRVLAGMNWDEEKKSLAEAYERALGCHRRE